MEATQALTEAIVEMQEDKALTLTRELLDGGTDPLAIFRAYQNALQEIGKRFEKVIIGGGQMDDKVCKYTGADAYVIDAVSGVNICKEWVN